MAKKSLRAIEPVPFTQVSIDDEFWAPRQRINREVTLEAQYEHLKSTGRLDAWTWKPGEPNEPHIFWDSDVAKWIEAAAYSLALHPDSQLEKRIDAYIDAAAAAQGPDGYLNSHFTRVEPDKRFTNLRDWHELYCAGHLIEAAIAYFQATGRKKLLEVMCRYADLIDRTFGPEDGQLRGYPGHEELELALVKLYRVTGEQRYLKLARFFVEERGRQPHYYMIEAERRGEAPKANWMGDFSYTQANAPVREQTEVRGHAVRAGYFYAAVTDVGAEVGDDSLVEAAKRLWANLTQRRMYITGGVGPTHQNEGFTVDYDLPNESAYAETCASIALILWAQRLLHVEPRRRYADVLERALYNGVLSGESLGGDAFFYTNRLAVYPAMEAFTPGGVGARRSPWFGCACCPPNLARLIASLGGYFYSQAEDELWVHLYMGSSVKLQLAGQEVSLRQETNYPWDGQVHLRLWLHKPARFALALRIPGWCRKAKLSVNGEKVKVKAVTRNGYARIERKWQDGDRIELVLPMPVERMEAHPRVRHDCGRVALQRGPLVYCLEEPDNGPDLNDIALPSGSELTATFDPDLLGGVMVVGAEALRRDEDGFGGTLYRPLGSQYRAVNLKAIPYYAWANRELGEMLVWMNALV
ncbi:MAG: glycoside hydrolase family 127 protein [Chloroflexi bacterium]|nr:glycoside hydrolase family 127 protein [Chloroflexota bacterium]